MSITKTIASIALTTALLSGGLSGTAADTEPPRDSGARLKAMTARAKSLRAGFADDQKRRPFTLVPQPILRYSDPARADTDGTIWLWTDGDRPVAVLCLFVAPKEFRRWNYELTSLVDQSLQVAGRPGWTWKPQEQRRTWIALDEDVSTKSAVRKQQLRSIARQFQGNEELDGKSYELRLLPRPVYRYADESGGILDGALFALAYGTNPEILIQVEARREDSGPARWFVGFARLSSAALSVGRSGRNVWSVESVPRFRPTEPYFSAYGPDPIEESP